MDGQGVYRYIAGVTSVFGDCRHNDPIGTDISSALVVAYPPTTSATLWAYGSVLVSPLLPIEPQ